MLTRLSRHPLPPFLLLAALLGLALAMTGCGSDEQDSEIEDLGYFLDPPELGEQAFETVTEGVPVLCYHYFGMHFVHVASRSTSRRRSWCQPLRAMLNDFVLCCWPLLTSCRRWRTSSW